MLGSISSRINRIVPLTLAVAFAVAHTQSAPFYSNQNQYLLHGLAEAGYGQLHRDWLANTRDPTPAFSLGVAAAYLAAGLGSLQVVYFALLIGYFLAMWWLVAAISSIGRSNAAGIRFAALFIAAHAALLRYASVQLTGTDYPWFFQSGVAGQYVLGPGLQPSAFGVLIVASLAAFANGRPILASAAGALAVAIHATYILPVALLTTGYLIHSIVEGRPRVAASVGLVALAIVAPIVAYTLITFPTSDNGYQAGSFAESQRILAEERIPHHAVVSRWFDVVAGLQVLWMVAGIAALARTKLFIPTVLMAVGALVLTLVQIATGDRTLALLFPWRVSAILVPVATAVLAARASAFICSSGRAQCISCGCIAAASIGGAMVMILGLGYRMNESERPMLEYVRNHLGPDDIYLIPTRFPPVGSGRGSVSTSFTSPPRPKPGSNLIPIDLQRFRLATGAPIFVDFKSVPYASFEVLEWSRRVRLVQAWYEENDWDAAGIRNHLLAEGITHAVLPRKVSISAKFLEELYVDDAYGVYRVR